jgi:hypothetical protein
MCGRVRCFLLAGCALCATLEAPRAGATLGEDLARLRAAAAEALVRSAALEAASGRSPEASRAQGEELASRGPSRGRALDGRAGE